MYIHACTFSISHKKCHKTVGNEASHTIKIHKNNTNHNTHKINQCNAVQDCISKEHTEL